MERLAESNFAGLFEAIALRHPERIAVVDGARQWTYREMLDDVLGTARWLLEDQAVAINENVCVRMNNSYELLVSCLAINYIGACWMPLSFEIPKIDSMVNDASVRLVLTELPNVRVASERVKQFNREQVHQDLNLFLVYSSGSTGTPKGVLQTQRAFLNALEWRFSVVPNGPSTRMGAHIFFIWEAFRPLLCGGTVYVIPKLTLLDGEALSAFLTAHEISEIQFTPSALAIWLRHLERHPKEFPQLTHVLLCGEIVRGELARRLHKALPKPVELLNLYSISEAPDLAIGNLRENLHCDIHPLTTFISENTISVTETGEIIASSPSVSPLGYLGRETLNAEKFDHGPTPPRYHTGDRGSFVDGLLTIQGRCDFMKKVRGYSVQLDELEEEIVRLTSAANVVLEVNAEGTEIHAAIQQPKINDRESIFQLLRSELPSYSVPTRITLIEDDLTVVDPASGKRLRRELLETNSEQLLATLWLSEVGSIPNAADDFFVMGGDSLSAVSLVIKINAKFGTEFKIQDIYEHSTFEGIRELITGAKSQKEHPLQPNQLTRDVLEIVSRHRQTRFVAPSFTSLRDAKHALVTGASGYLGTWLVKALTDDGDGTVSVLVRDIPRWRVQVREHYGIELPWERIHCIEGDLELDLFGLSPAVFDQYVGRFDAIAHCASLVNFSLSYARLQQTNKTGIETLLAWATEASFHFMSSNSVYPTNFGTCEETMLDELQDAENSAYGQSKWVLEKALRTLEVPTACYRLGNIGPHKSGVYNPHDVQMMLIEACVDLGLGIDEERYSVEFSTLESVVDLILSKDTPGVTNFVNSKRYALRSLQFPQMVSLEEWQVRAEADYPLLCQMLHRPEDWLADTNDYAGERPSFDYEERLKSLLHTIRARKSNDT